MEIPPHPQSVSASLWVFKGTECSHVRCQGTQCWDQLSRKSKGDRPLPLGLSHPAQEVARKMPRDLSVPNSGSKGSIWQLWNHKHNIFNHTRAPKEWSDRPTYRTDVNGNTQRSPRGHLSCFASLQKGFWCGQETYMVVFSSGYKLSETLNFRTSRVDLVTLQLIPISLTRYSVSQGHECKLFQCNMRFPHWYIKIQLIFSLFFSIFIIFLTLVTRFSIILIFNLWPKKSWGVR